MPVFIGGLFKDRGQAERVITALLDSGVASSEISLVAREVAEEDLNARAEAAGEDGQFKELALQSAWERLGWQGGARPAYRNSIPPNIEMAFVAAGPLAIAIGGAQLVAASGGIVGSMTNFGFTHELARQWYSRIAGGNAWVMVRTDEARSPKVKQLFEKYHWDLAAESNRHW
ncbi:MAG: hypothetical protein K0Q72_1454 [Armatimonadetes bacterium]|nr:hypothetical protein [Armatimonadota bacterium]